MWETSSTFWGNRSAFIARTVARQGGKSSTVTTPSGTFVVPSLQSMERKWNAIAAKGQLPGGLKASSIKVTDGATPLVRRLLAPLAPALVESFDIELGRVAVNAFDQWPVSSGFSKSSIFLEYTTTDIEFTGAVGNAAPYAIYIKGGPWSRLIRQPAKQAASNIAANLRIGA